MMKKTLLAAGLMIFSLTPLVSNATIIATGTVTDAIGDSTNTSPDMISGSVSIDSGGFAIFTVEYAPGTSLADAAATFNLDVDKDPATGWAGVNSLHWDSDIMGTDYIVRIFGESIQGNGEVYGYSGGSWNLLASALPVVYSGTTEQITVSLAVLGGIDGSMNFDVLSQQQLTEFTFTPVGDYMPDVGGIGSVTVPEPGGLALLGIGFAGFLASRRKKLATATCESCTNLQLVR